VAITWISFYKHTYQKVIALAQEHEHLIVVIFPHGWRNSGQSGNVIDFNEFLHQLATNTDRDTPSIVCMASTSRGAVLV
jgi:hypothetical protein